MNIAKILKYCPKETKLYSPLFGEVTLFEVTEDKIKVYSIIKCAIYKFNYDGTFGTEYTSVECMLFPSKDQRDWNKFRLPVKRGDIMMLIDGSYPFISNGIITKEGSLEYICGGTIASNNFRISHLNGSCAFWTDEFCIPASKKAKKELFDTIAKAGYRWNADTLELEKMSPKFKEGDVVVDEQGNLCLVSKIKDNGFMTIAAALYTSNNLRVFTSNAVDRYIQLSTIASTTDRNKLYSALIKEGYKYDKEQHKLIKQELKPFDKVLVRNQETEPWNADIYLKHLDDTYSSYKCTRSNYIMCIPYEGNEYLLDTTDNLK